MTTLHYPKALLLDWHGTLVDTMDAMYRAMDETLRRLAALGLRERLADPSQSRNVDDAKLVVYVREHGRLHPKIPAERKVSRTDILEVLFGPDDEAKRIAHEEFCHCYARHCGSVTPFEAEVRHQLLAFRELGIRMAIQTNRSRGFLENELARVDGGGWPDLFDAVVCGDDMDKRKPSPEPILLTLRRLGLPASLSCWFVGDSTTDTMAAKDAGVASVFYNGAGWDPLWIEQIFPGSEQFPHRPDAVVDSFRHLLDLIRTLQPEALTRLASGGAVGLRPHNEKIPRTEA